MPESGRCVDCDHSADEGQFRLEASVEDTEEDTEMAFAFTDQHITDYYHHHYTVFRGILEPTLLEELRLAGAEVERISHEVRKVKVSRSPALGLIMDDLSPRSHKAFEDYRDYPPLIDAVQRVLTPEHHHGQLPSLSLFLTETDGPVVQDWHRDYAEGHPGIDDEEFGRLKLDPTVFVQINAALYTDMCLWFVPGSAGRPDTTGELTAAGPAYNGLSGRGRILNPELEGKSYAAREAICRAYCEGMPHAVNLVLDSGDFAMYRPIAWHTGCYAPHRKRLTIHDGVASPRQRVWLQRLRERRAAANA